MKRRMIVAGMCVGAWLCGSVHGQETVVTNLLITGNLRQDANSEASGMFSTALGFESIASGSFSHAEGEVTMATGNASHSEGGGTLAGGDNSHAEGEMTEALADNSHAGGTYSRVRTQDVNSVIFATGMTNGMKETQFPDTAHFDHLVTLEPALDASNAILSRAENDQRYLVTTNGVMNGELNMDENSIQNVGGVAWHGDGIDIEARASTSSNVWGNWNADMLDGYHADSFATTQQLAGKLSVTGGLADAMFKVTTYGMWGPEDPRAQLAMSGNGTIDLIGGEETIAEDGMHIKMRWDVAADDPSDPCIDLKPYAGASLKGLGGTSDRWWTDGRFSATNAGMTS